VRPYDAFAKNLIASGLITDPWLDGEPRFEEAPIVLTSAEATRLAKAAAAVGEVYDEAVRIVSDETALLDDFFALTPVQKAMFAASYPMWHGIARVDLFVTDDGLAITEVNCDTPTGEAEAVVLGELAKQKEPKLVDPNEKLGAAFIRMIGAMKDAFVGRDAPKSAGLVYPTEFTEDLSLVRLYKRWLERAGYEVALGSPYNLRSGGGEDPTVRVFDDPVSVLVRHYKTDWWSERASAWDDEELADTAPLHRPLLVALEAQAAKKTVVINPFGSVLAQNKRMMAFLWEHIHRFSIGSQDTIRELVPVTSRLESLHPELLRATREDWVLKSDYGAEGDEVVVGRLVSAETWEASLAHARKGRWIAQRYFDAVLDQKKRTTNLGVFLVAGAPAGIYARAQEGATDTGALSLPVLLRQD
jgi:glutathionylspermidine synthase